ncbi:MAG TPA: hypothetical protein PLE72_11795 [Azospira sp.]|nr:hypothetical protein [Accumulibacter sp.]HNJ77443.1 hypothetical protein [Azospira sp.]HNN08786.1 hypothetical protein [Azospira sp.]HNN46066.1 hypothetical protein [Azospira sp.]
MKKQIVLGAFAAASVALSPLASAAENPFQIGKLEAGYQLAQADTKAKDGKCGEAKCGAEKKADKKKDGKCGEAKCGADKKKEAACGADKKKDGSCGAKK